MHSKYDIEKKLGYIRDEIREMEIGGMNDLLSPEPIGCDPDSMSADIRFVKHGWEKNHRGEVHGGVIAAMFDTAMGMTTIAYSGYEGVSTADLNVSFIRPFTGDSFIFRAEIIHPGRNIVRTRARAFDDKCGKCLASATANFVHMK